MKQAFSERSRGIVLDARLSDKRIGLEKEGQWLTDSTCPIVVISIRLRDA
jgi:hypothetical protein